MQDIETLISTKLPNIQWVGYKETKCACGSIVVGTTAMSALWFRDFYEEGVVCWDGSARWAHVGEKMQAGGVLAVLWHKKRPAVSENTDK